ncbi:PHO85 cyclin-5 [Linderina pennispora]|nr:PHO85 cyclin-5 [Linderina pennispora]
MSFREFMSKDTPLMAVSCNNTMASPAASPKEAGSTPKPKKPDVTKCGRRMFVAALVSASKFMYDRTYSNRAWNKITKLPLAQISDMERAFLSMIDYRLYVDQRTYDKFHRLLARSGMRNGRLMVCEPASAGDAAGPHLQSQQQQQQQTQPQSQSQQQTQMSPATADFTFAAPSATPSPEQQRAKVQKMMIQYSMSASPNTPVTGDLRSAMNVPLSVASTPAGMHSAVSMPMMGGSDPRAMQVQEQLLNFLRAKQAQQQQQQQRIILQHQQQVMHHHHVSQQRVPAAGEVSFE